MEQPPARQARAPSYHGSGGALFWLMFRTTMYNLLTLGFYRFWQRTKTRQHFWNGIRVAGSPLEYTGTGLEKFLGFLIAVVFLAVYLGLFQIGFFFLGLKLTGGAEWVGVVSSLPVIPLIYYAQYRAQRYVLSRTQLRGIRFSMSQDAVRYVFIALWHLLLTVLSFGILYPRMQWNLEKFRTDRTSYGTMRMLLTGSWFSLLRPWLWVLACVYLPAIVMGLMALQQNTVGAGFMTLGLIFLPFAWVNYRVASFRILTEAKSAGGVSFTSNARTGSVLAVYVLGYLLMGVIMAVIGTIVGSVVALLSEGPTKVAVNWETLSDLGQMLTFGLIMAVYLAVFLAWSAMHAVFISQPLLSHFVTTLLIHDAQELDLVRQREQDDFLEAEGFADALDVGGAF